MGSLLNKLINHANDRREETHPSQHSRKDHPERIFPSEITTHDDTNGKQSSFAKTSEGTCSEFYMACRNNDMDKVKQLIKMMTPEDIDRIEPNGSTALHAACFHG